MKDIIETQLNKIMNEKLNVSLAEEKQKPQTGLFDSIFGGSNGKCDCKAKYEKQLKHLKNKMKSDEETISSMSQRLAEQDSRVIESSQTIK